MAASWLDEHLECVWLDVARRAVRGLQARGVDADVAEDAVQEAAARLCRVRPDVASPDELARWTFAVAQRIVVDRTRRRLVTVPLDDEGLRAASAMTGGVESRVLARLELLRVARAVRLLRTIDQEALRAEVTGDAQGADRREAVRLAVRLHRARARLAQMLEGLGAITGAAWRRLRPAGSLVAGGSTSAAGLAAMGLLLVLPFAGVEDVRPPTDALPSGRSPRAVTGTIELIVAPAAVHGGRQDTPAPLVAPAIPAPVPGDVDAVEQQPAPRSVGVAPQVTPAGRSSEPAATAPSPASAPVPEPGAPSSGWHEVVEDPGSGVAASPLPSLPIGDEPQVQASLPASAPAESSLPVDVDGAVAISPPAALLGPGSS